VTLYTDEHASALATLTESGAAVTFTRVAEAFDSATGLVTPTSTSVAGYAIRARGRPDTYRALSLVEATAPTLLFAPTTFGSLPKPGDMVTWNSVAHSVKDVNPLSPAGTAILARVVIAAVSP